MAVTDENRVLRVELGARRDDDADEDDDDDVAASEGGQRGRRDPQTAFVSDYVRQGVNAPADFNNPDNLALDKRGNLFITEDTTYTAGHGHLDGRAGVPPHVDGVEHGPLREPDRLRWRTERYLFRSAVAPCCSCTCSIAGEPAAPDKRDLAVMITQARRHRD